MNNPDTITLPVEVAERLIAALEGVISLIREQMPDEKLLSDLQKSINQRRTNKKG